MAVERIAGETMGTGWSLQAVGPPPRARAGVEAVFERVTAQMSQWRADSTLSHINRAAAAEWHALPAEFATVMHAAVDIAAASGGAFNPGLGQLTEAWGFGASGPRDDAPVTGDVVDTPRIEFDAATGRVRRHGSAAIDLSGIAKGFAVDLVAEWLLDQGTRHFLIEVGGELRGEGIKPDGQPWWVDIEMPPDSTVAPWRLALHDLSVATSGSYRRGFSAGGRHYSHSLDPRTGRPIVNNVASVTVIHRQCMMADGWATALTVVGPEEGIALADRQGLATCIVAGDREFLSRGWRAMLD